MKSLFLTGALLGASFISSDVLAVSCAGLSTWASSTVYTQGNKVQHSGRAYTANYWTQGNNPTTSSGQWQHWTDNGACDTAASSVTPSSSVAPSSRSSSSRSSASSFGFTCSEGNTAVCSSRSSSSMSSSSIGFCPTYVAGTNYSLGTVVTNVGGTYTCKIPGWCASTATWAYAPGTGTYWQDAWTAGGNCPGTSASSVSSSSIRPSSSSIAPSSSSRSSLSSSSVSSVVTNNGRDLVGYWENWHWPLEEMTSIPNYTVLNISFPRINADGSLFLGNEGGYQNNPTAQQITAAKAQGKKVLLSIGGANATFVLTTQAHEDNFVNSFIAIKDQFGLDGIDIDTEKGLHTNPNAQINLTNPQYSADYLARAIKRLKARYGSSFLLTMAPETAHTIGANLPGNWLGQYNWGVYLPLINALRDDISWIQMQYYNTGSMPGKNGQFYNSATQDGLVAWTEALIEGFQIGSTGVSYLGLPANKVIIGLPASTAPTAAGSGYTNPAVVKAAMRCLRSGDCGVGYKPAKTYPDLRGIMAWSTWEDYVTGYAFSNAVRACALNNQCN
ncbi:glycosyl hydrolase family 18 protein [Cellvibrio sp. pealriver]|uniref:glycosyl hydrolase family 18 protein n=1 Tax=Cellvibrio sp. pealriver TaxID=1622269 RepID=UPI0009E497E5|nr:glycosyl hydrolase family 18 protein [Cellvibrio sp. pealriver]